MSRLTIVAVALALVIASAGGAVAGSLITSAQIKDGTIATVDLHSGAVTSGKIKNGTVTGTDVNEGTLATVPSAVSLQGKRIVEGTKVYTGSVNLLNIAGLQVGAYGLVDEVGVCEPQISVSTSVSGASVLIVRQGGSDGSNNPPTLYFKRALSPGSWSRIDGIQTVGTASINYTVGGRVVHAEVSWYPKLDGTCFSYVSAYGG